MVVVYVAMALAMVVVCTSGVRDDVIVMVTGGGDMIGGVMWDTCCDGVGYML